MGRESLGELELLVMLAALRLGPHGANAVSIAGEIEERTGRKVRRATVHATLSKLEGKEFISTRCVEGGGRGLVRGGARPELVKVEPKGIAAIRATTEGILAMMGKGKPDRAD